MGCVDHLQAASSCVFCEYSWTPGDIVQAEDRCHRIGQHSSVNITFLHARHSVDDHIWNTIASKLGSVGRVRSSHVPPSTHPHRLLQHLVLRISFEPVCCVGRSIGASACSSLLPRHLNVVSTNILCSEMHVTLRAYMWCYLLMSLCVAFNCLLGSDLSRNFCKL